MNIQVIKTALRIYFNLFIYQSLFNLILGTTQTYRKARFDHIGIVELQSKAFLLQSLDNKMSVFKSKPVFDFVEIIKRVIQMILVHSSGEVFRDNLLISDIEPSGRLSLTAV